MRKNDHENIVSLGIILSLFLAIMLLTLFYRDWLVFGLVLFIAVCSVLLLSRVIKYPIVKGIVSIFIGLFMGLLLWIGIFLAFFSMMG
jgi:hypothetical protein